LIDGYVQRVGYRYKVAYIARKYNLKGKIENIKDGGVEIIVEGNKEDIESFVNDIDIKGYPIHVENIDTKYTEVKNEFQTFMIVTGSFEEEMIKGFGTGALYLDKIIGTQ
jgi:acylphosphatase